MLLKINNNNYYYSHTRVTRDVVRISYTVLDGSTGMATEGLKECQWMGITGLNH